MRRLWLLVALVVGLLGDVAQGERSAGHLEAMPNGLVQYTDRARHVEFALPSGFSIDPATPAVDDPAYDVAFVGTKGYSQVRLRLDELTGNPLPAGAVRPINVATPERLALSATTYAMNRYKHRHPGEVFLRRLPPPPGASALCLVVGRLPKGSRYEAEKTVFIGVSPNRVYVISMLFRDGDVAEALKVSETVLATLRL